MREPGTPLYQLTLVVLSVYVLAALVAESFGDFDPETRRVLQYVDLGVCLVFLVDIFVNLYRAEMTSGKGRLTAKMPGKNLTGYGHSNIRRRPSVLNCLTSEQNGLTFTHLGISHCMGTQ